MLTPPAQRQRARHELRTAMEQARADGEALSLLAVDGAGNLVEVVGATLPEAAHTLAALGAANLAASLQMVQLAHMHQAGVPLLIAEGSQGTLVLAGQPTNLIFIALLGPKSILGLTRLAVRQLAQTVWIETTPFELVDLDGTATTDLAGLVLESLDDIF